MGCAASSPTPPKESHALQSARQEVATLRNELTQLSKQLNLLKTHEQKVGNDNLTDDGVINSIIDRLWRPLSSMVHGMMNTHFEPALNKAMAGAMAPLNQVSIDKKLSGLGSKPVKFTNPRVVARPTPARGASSSSNLILNVFMEWNGDSALHLDFTQATLNLKNVVVTGELSLEFVGIVDPTTSDANTPFITGLRLYFLKPFDINLEVEQGKLAYALNSDLVKATLTDMISVAINKKLLFPCNHSILLSGGGNVDVIEVTRPLPAYLMKLNVIKVDGLQVGSSSWVNSSRYVEIVCGASKFRSPTQQSTEALVLNFPVLLLLWAQSLPHIVIDVYDHSAIGSDVCLGTLSVAVSDVLKWGPNLQSIQLVKDNKNCGKITMSATSYPVERATTSVQTQDLGLLVIGIYSATLNNCLAHIGECWVQCWSSSDSLLVGKTQALLPIRLTEAESMELKDQMSILQKYGIGVTDISKILDVEQSRIERVIRGEDSSASVTDVIEWNEGFELVLNAPLEHIQLKIEVWFKPSLQQSETSATPTLLGSLTLRAGDLCSSDSKMPRVAMKINGIGITLNLGARRHRCKGYQIPNLSTVGAPEKKLQRKNSGPKAKAKQNPSKNERALSQ